MLQKEITNTFFACLSYTVICCIFLLGFNPHEYGGFFRSKHPVDDSSYMAHGFTLGVDHNLQYYQSVAIWKTDDKQVPSHPIGPGLFAAPFILVFSIVDRIQQNEFIQDHKKYLYSWSFFGFVFSTYFFFILSLYFNIKVIECLGFKLARWHFLLISSSYGILFYVLQRPVTGPVYSLFTMTLCLWSSCKALNKMKLHIIPHKYILTCAFSIILTLQVRPADINILLLPFIIAGFSFFIDEENRSSRKILQKSASILIGYLLGLFIPFGYLNYYLYGGIYPSSNIMYATNTIHPVPSLSSFNEIYVAIKILLSRFHQIYNICFTSEFGIAFFSCLYFLVLFLSYFT